MGRRRGIRRALNSGWLGWPMGWTRLKCGGRWGNGKVALVAQTRGNGGDGGVRCGMGRKDGEKNEKLALKNVTSTGLSGECSI